MRSTILSILALSLCALSARADIKYRINTDPTLHSIVSGTIDITGASSPTIIHIFDEATLGNTTRGYP